MAKEKNKPYDETHKVVPLYLVISFINRGLGDTVIYLLQKYGTSVQFLQIGEGTANKDIYDLLGSYDNTKDIVYSIVPETKYDECMRELDNYLKAAKKRPGIAFSIPFVSVAGRTCYHLLSDTVE